MYLNEISKWDFPNTTLEPEGYDMKSVPELSRRNFEFLTERLNEVIRQVNELTEENQRLESKINDIERGL